MTVVPLSTNVRRLYPLQVMVPAGAAGLRRDSKAQAEQVRSVAVERVGDRIGALDGRLLSALDDALRLHLAL